MKKFSLTILAIALVFGLAHNAFAQESERNFTYDLTSDGKGIQITGYTGTNRNLVIPATIEGYPVRIIGNNKQIGGELTRTSLQTLVIPNGVTTITLYTFKGQGSLRTVSLADSIEEIGMSAFEGCSSLTEINLPANIKKLYDSAFKDCRELYNLKIPTSISGINFHLTIPPESRSRSQFSGCGKLPIAIRQRLRDLGYIGRDSGF